MRKLKLTATDPKIMTVGVISPLTDVSKRLDDIEAKLHNHVNLPYLETLTDQHIDALSDVSASNVVENLFTQPQNW